MTSVFANSDFSRRRATTLLWFCLLHHLLATTVFHFEFGDFLIGLTRGRMTFDWSINWSGTLDFAFHPVGILTAPITAQTMCSCNVGDNVWIDTSLGTLLIV
jgi:hypothetical protein